MATFAEFVQAELPKRPFTDTDGAPGQILVRSSVANHAREMVWADAPSGTVAPVTYEAGVNLSGHRAVRLDATRKLIYADNMTAVDAFCVFGIVKSAAIAGSQIEVIHSGEITEPTWNWTVGQPIYLGTGGALIQSAPVSPALFSLVVGFATATTTMVVAIGVPIALLQ